MTNETNNLAHPAPEQVAPQASERDVGRRAFEWMRDKQNALPGARQDTREWRDLTDAERTDWTQDATRRPNLYRDTPSAPADRAEAQDAAVVGLMERLETLLAQTVSGTEWRHEDGEISRHYTYDGEPMADAIGSGFATGRTDTPDAEAVCQVMNAATHLIEQIRSLQAERDALREALEPLEPLAALADFYDGRPPTKYHGDTSFELHYSREHKVEVTVGDLRMIRAALAMQGEGS